MKTKIRLWLPTTMFALSSVLLLTNCNKDDNATKDATLPVLTTAEVTEVTQTTATSGGAITSDGGATITERGVCWSTSQSPTIADNKTTDSSGTGSFTSAITGLIANTTYYIRAYATNSKGTGYGSAMLFTTLEGNSANIVFNPNITYGSMTDIEGNTYKTVTIGTQTWMAENLKVTKYNDSTDIPNITDDTEWVELTDGAYCNYENDPNNVAAYGRLYNWYAVKTGKLCPTGWHESLENEWRTLENYLIAQGYNYDGTNTEDKIAKAMASSSGWDSYTAEGVIGNTDYPEKQNASGFTALPGGYRSIYGEFNFIGIGGYWWTSAESNDSNGYGRDLGNVNRDLSYGSRGKITGYSVRCVKD